MRSTIPNIAVEQQASSLSMGNHDAFGTYPRAADLEATGLGFNYGVELSVEKFFGNGYYGTILMACISLSL